MRFTQKSIRNLSKAVGKNIKKHERAVETSVKIGGLFIQRESQKIVPVDTGFLRASAYTRSEGTGSKVQVFVGYTAYYGIYVHENLSWYHTPPTRAKFLTGIVDERMRDIRRVMRDAYKKALRGKLKNPKL